MTENEGERGNDLLWTGMDDAVVDSNTITHRLPAHPL